jgi:uncharacterized protein YxeA
MVSASNLPQKDLSRGKLIKDRNPHMTIITILLVIQVLISVYMLVQDVLYQQQRSQMISTVAEYTTTLDELTTQMLVDYKVDVYNNPGVDTTAKQAVMANEYNFNATMLVVKQNNRLLEILAQMK